MKTLQLLWAMFLTTLTSEFLFAQCAPPTAQADLDIANVRARIISGADIWWDAVNSVGPKYEVPKGSGKHSLFSGSIWIGGVDGNGQLKLAAQTYRQNGLDFWPGPLDMTSASVNTLECAAYNRLWKIDRVQVLDFIDSILIPGYFPPEVIRNWPGNGDYQSTQTIPNLTNPNFAHFLAPYFDNDGDGNYDLVNGDYPYFDLSGSANCCNTLHGDQAIWWVINDVGNTHTETGCNALGVEMQCQAFAFNSTDADINNATFYQYKLINRSSIQVNDFHFGFFADTDLGNSLDDYVGCDVGRGMGYSYNGDSLDEVTTGYGLHPPTVGIDFLQTPTSMSGLSMTNFITFTSGTGSLGDPLVCTDYYNYLRSIDLNGNFVTHLGIPCKYMYPYNSDPTGIGTGGTPQSPWTEITEGNVSGDRRFLMSAGPFTLNPGAVHCITMAAIWTRDTTDAGPYYSLAALQTADDKIQNFFDSCYHSSAVGIPERDIVSASVYPNPVSDILEINFGKNISEGKFILYDIVGKAIKEVNVKNKTSIHVSCKEFASGIYVYRILTADGKSGSGKVVIK